MPYEVFRRTTVRVEEPTLSLTPGGKIGLNSAAARIFAEAGIKSVLLLWDKVSNKCALKAAPKTDTNAYAVSVQPNKQAGSLTAKSFLNHIGWSTRQRETLPATWNEKEKMLEITLPHEFLSPHKGRDPKPKMKTNP